MENSIYTQESRVDYHVVFMLLDILIVPPHIKEEQEELLQEPEEPDGSMLTLLAVKSEVDVEDISSHCAEVEVKLESDTEFTDDSDSDHCEETCGG